MKSFGDRDDDGGDGSGGGFRRSSVRPRKSGGTANKLTTMDALTYLKQIKETFKDQNEKYDEFLDAMKDFKAHRVDTSSVIARVRRLFEGYSDLILGFCTFLPKEYEKTIYEPQAKKPVEFSESGNKIKVLTTMDAVTYLKEIQETFKDHKEKYDEFLDAMKDFKAHRVDTLSIIARVRILFDGYPRLLLGFNTFLPKECEITIDEPQAKKHVELTEAYQFVNKIKVIIIRMGTTLQLQEGRRRSNSRDFISGMPDDILVMILSLLPVKDARVTSILSTRWRFLWSFVTNLNFDGTENLNKMVMWSGVEQNTAEQPKYIHQVKSVIQSYKHPIVKYFRIHMVLRGHYMGVIDEWLQFAANRKVEFLELDLLGKCKSGIESGQHYNFPSKFFETKIFRSPSSSNAMVGDRFPLQKLILKEVNVTESLFQEFLTNCPHLETIVIHYSIYLNHIRVSGRALKLKHLEIAKVFSLEFIYLSDFDLVSFTYIGKQTDLRLTNLPKLKNIHMFREDVSMENTQVFNNISSCALSLQALSINISNPVESVMLDSIPELPNLRTLRLALGGSRYDCLLYLACILRACPNLVNFTIRQLWTSPIIDDSKKDRDVIINNRNVNLKFVELEGYYGRKCDLELAEYIKQTAVALKKIVIDNPFDWRFHHSSAAARKFLKNKGTARSTTRRQLEPVLPKGVELCIL